MPSYLILIEHDGKSVKRSSLGAIAFVRQLGGVYSLLVAGSKIGEVASSLEAFGAEEVLVVDDPLLAEPLADRYAEVVAVAAREIQAGTVVGTASAFSKDILPRVAALIDAAMISEIVAAELEENKPIYHRLLNAGSTLAKVSIAGKEQVLSVRATSYTPPQPNGAVSPIRQLECNFAALPAATSFVSRETRSSTRPDLAEARVVIGGGRPLNDKATFERLIGGLADVCGGAVAATRAAVDAGMAPNDCQVGQTGKTIAPELYIGVGISGAVQHLAGIKDSKVIVAINRDPDAPVFQLANYALVGDLFEVVPQLIDAIQKR